MLLLMIILLCCSANEGNESSVNKRIVGGQDALKHEFPWQIVLRWDQGITKDELICGGSLVDKYHVLIAAHCFEHGINIHYYHVLLGEHNRNIKDQREQKRQIKKITIYPQYNAITYDNDIAIITLKSPAIINEYVSAISLPSFLDFERPGMICTATGWGKTKSAPHTVTLQKVDVPIVSFAVCNGYSSYHGKLTGNMFCAGYINGSMDACRGDSGGPLQCKSTFKKSLVLNGIISWGNGCGSAHKYGVYVRVRHYLPWIQHMINKTNILQPTIKSPLPPSLSQWPSKNPLPPLPKITSVLRSKIPVCPISSKIPLLPSKILLPPLPKKFASELSKIYLPPLPKINFARFRITIEEKKNNNIN